MLAENERHQPGSDPAQTPAPRPPARRIQRKSIVQEQAAPKREGREVLCTWCGGATHVAPSAKSVVCPHCNKRLVVEDFHTASYHAVRLLATCGDVFVDKKGHIVAAVRATNITVEGKLTGDVFARGRVVIGKSAQVKGDIHAAQLKIESGATFAGRVEIGELKAGSASASDEAES